MFRDKLTTKERITAVESLKGKGPVEATTTAGYGTPETNYGGVGMRIANSNLNPLSKRLQYLDTALNIALDVIQQDKPDTVPDWNIRLKAAEILIKFAQQPEGEKGNVYNTLVIGDLRDLDEHDLLAKLQQMRTMSSGVGGGGSVVEGSIEEDESNDTTPQ